MRSDLYKSIQQPMIYMDMDCLILKPIDESYFDFDAKFGMAYGSLVKKDFNSGLIVFKDDVVLSIKKCSRKILKNTQKKDPFTDKPFGQI